MNLLESVATLPQVVDLHLAEGGPVKYMAGGRLEVFEAPPEAVRTTLEALVADLNEIERAQLDGRGSTTIVRVRSWGLLRILLFRTGGRYACAIRFERECPPALETLGLHPSVLTLPDIREGAIVISGPLRAGKTTLAASLLAAIDARRSLTAWVIEDAPEYVYQPSGVIHRIIVGPRRDFPTFAEAARAARRSGVDTLFLGELVPRIEDDDTVAAWLEAVMAGLLVIATVHAGSNVAALEMILEKVPEGMRREAQLLLARRFAAGVNLRLLPHASERRFVPASEIVLSDPAVHAAIRNGALDAIDNIAGTSPGMQRLSTDVERLVSQGQIARNWLQAVA